ncbi:MAG: polyphosphate kinase 2 family protein [Propionicimonas sp.]
MSAKKKKERQSTPTLSALLRLPQGPVSLADLDPAATPGYPGNGKADAPQRTEALGLELSDLQERLFAAGRTDPTTAPSVLVVLQGMDTSGKGGVVRHAMGLVDPQGVALASFKAPTAEERRHHYLWRIRRALPKPGMVGVFDRSHYEDVLVVRVEQLVPAEVWEKRYEEINRFEQRMVDSGTAVIKCMLNVSFDEQKKRLLARLDDPSKYWKYNPSDVEARSKWPAYQEAYAAALERCNTEAAPWHVIPADRKWYRNWAVAELLREKLASMNLSWPGADYEVEVERERVAAS